MVRLLFLLVAAVWAATIKMPRWGVELIMGLVGGDERKRKVLEMGIRYLVKKGYWLKYGEFGEEGLEWLKEEYNGLVWKMVELLERTIKVENIIEAVEEDENFLTAEERLAAFKILQGVKEELVDEKVNVKEEILKVLKEITEKGLEMDIPKGYRKEEVEEYLKGVVRHIRFVMGTKWNIWYVPEFVRGRLKKIMAKLDLIQEIVARNKLKIKDSIEDLKGMEVMEREILELVYKYMDRWLDGKKFLFELKGLVIKYKRKMMVEEFVEIVEAVIEAYAYRKRKELEKKDWEKELKYRVWRVDAGIVNEDVVKAIEKRFGNTFGYKPKKIDIKEMKEKINEEVEDEMVQIGEDELAALMELTVKKEEEYEVKVKKALRGANLEERTLIEAWWKMVNDKEIGWEEAWKGFGKWGLVMKQIVKMLRQKYDVRVIMVPEEMMVEGVKGMIREYIRYEDRKRKVQK
jgi:hypothetical protein